ncbi:integral membrane protein AefA [Salmonella bongori]|nr:integral membrane protein AefA [Salmonella bongori]
MHSKLKMKKLLDNAIVKNILWLISEKLYFVILIFFWRGAYKSYTWSE